MNTWRLCLLMTACLSAASLVAAADAPPAATPDEELDEVLVSGARTIRDPEEILAWLQRLVGQFRYEGYVELGGDGAPPSRRTVTGANKCVSFGPAVHCVMQVTWPGMQGGNGEALPGGVSTLAPAMVMYGADLNYLAVNFLQVDNRGMAHSGQGYLKGNTLVTTSGCVDLPGNCQRITRINAQPDGKLINLQVDIERDGKRVVRQAFVLHRTATAPRAALQHVESPVPVSGEMSAWLRRLVGRFWIEPSWVEKFADGITSARGRPAGIADCVAIGAGAGVHCIFYTPNSRETWQERASGKGRDRPDTPLHRDEVLKVSRVVEYGLDPAAGRIRMMVVEQGSAQQVTGVLSGDTVASRTRCWNSPAMPPCDIGQLIDAPADGGDIGITQVTPHARIRQVLHRMSRDEAAAAGRQIEAAQREAGSARNVQRPR